MKSSRYVLYATVVAAVIVLALLASFGLRDRNQVAASPTPTSLALTASPTPTTSPTTSVTTAPSPSASGSLPPTSRPAGAITGGLGYPSNFIPPLTVYAISVADERIFFSVETRRFGGDSATSTPGRPEYTISGVAPGTYYVLAYRNDMPSGTQGSDFPGLYSQYVLRCKQSAPPPACTDHTLVPVSVAAGETVSGIDVTDWYHGSPTDQPPTRYPARPR